jgi:hypothetical protein
MHTCMLTRMYSWISQVALFSAREDFKGNKETLERDPSTDSSQYQRRSERRDFFLGKFSEAGKWREREQEKEQEREKLENEIERLGRLEREVVVVLSRRISP